MNALTYAGIAIGKTNNHLNIFYPGKLYIVINHAQDTPIKNVNSATHKTIKAVLNKYVNNKLSIK